jgi:hypothetical protein
MLSRTISGRAPSRSIRLECMLRKLRKFPLSLESDEYESLQKLFVKIRRQIGFWVCRCDICNRPVDPFVYRGCQKSVDVAGMRPAEHRCHARDFTALVDLVSHACKEDVNHHALAIDVTDFQVCQFSASYSGGVERHQQSAMIRSQSCVYESRDFFPAEDRRKAKRFFRIGRLGDAPGFLESFDVEESQRCQSLGDCYHARVLRASFCEVGS